MNTDSQDFLFPSPSDTAEDGTASRTVTLPVRTSGPESYEPGMTLELMVEKVTRRVLKEELSAREGRERARDRMNASIQTLLLSNNERLKEVLAKMSKEAEPLALLLSSSGLKKLKATCLDNIELKAGSKAELDVLNQLMYTLRDEGSLVKDSAKADDDVAKGFRGERNTLRQQILNRAKKGLKAKDPEMTVLIEYLKSHLGVLDLSDTHLDILFHLVYLLSKYLNKLACVGPGEDEGRKACQKDIWRIVEARRKKSNDGSWRVMKDKIRERIHIGYEEEK